MRKKIKNKNKWLKWKENINLWIRKRKLVSLLSKTKKGEKWFEQIKIKETKKIIRKSIKFQIDWWYKIIASQR